MRGEHDGVNDVHSIPAGSSPHARGALVWRACDRRGRWIIPACAGSTYGETSVPDKARDHPRMRGEHHARSRAYDRYVGSSPHARGAQILASIHKRDTGIIPACAGSTLFALRRLTSSKDHPRMRGEHSFPAKTSTSPTGSSPHARGAPAVLRIYQSDVRIIPACAGSTN